MAELVDQSHTHLLLKFLDIVREERLKSLGKEADRVLVAPADRLTQVISLSRRAGKIDQKLLDQGHVRVVLEIALLDVIPGTKTGGA